MAKWRHWAFDRPSISALLPTPKLAALPSPLCRTRSLAISCCCTPIQMRNNFHAKLSLNIYKGHQSTTAYAFLLQSSSSNPFKLLLSCPFFLLSCLNKMCSKITAHNEMSFMWQVKACKENQQQQHLLKLQSSRILKNNSGKKLKTH